MILVLRRALALLMGLALSSSLWTTGAVADEPARWVQVTAKADFTPRDSCGELVFKNRMWLLGGWLNSFQDPPRDVWSSADGIKWDKVTGEAPWKHSDFPMTAVFNDRMYIMGGWHGGRLAHASASSAVWSSTDGATWKQETETAGWSPRMAAGIVVFKDRLWIMGGIQKYYFGNDDDLLNDVWSTADGIRWERATAAAPWSKRAYINPVVLNGKMYVFAGGNYLPKYQAKNDVWSSSDGKTWTLETDAAPWSPRIWFTAAEYRDKMWILGGWSNNPSRNWPDVWHSTDGKTWTEFKSAGSWKERHEHSTYIFQDKLWVVGGHAQPLSNEAWSLSLPRR